jgi:hypothetical protein
MGVNNTSRCKQYAVIPLVLVLILSTCRAENILRCVLVTLGLTQDDINARHALKDSRNPET